MRVNHIKTVLERNVHAHAEARDGEVEIFAKIANHGRYLKETLLEQGESWAGRLFEKRQAGETIHLDSLHNLGEGLAPFAETNHGNAIAGGRKGFTFISDPGIVRKQVFHEHENSDGGWPHNPSSCGTTNRLPVLPIKE